MEDALRKTAIRRHVLGGEPPKTIYKSLNRSKKWFFKWLKRYQTGGKDWNKNRKPVRVSQMKTAEPLKKEKKQSQMSGNCAKADEYSLHQGECNA
jgi:transposase